MEDLNENEIYSKDFSIFDSVIERYYDQRFITNDQLKVIPPGQDHYVYQHHNGICIIGLAPNHFIFHSNEVKILQVDFNVGKQDRGANQVHGKKKKGGIQLGPSTILCRVNISYKKLITEEPEENNIINQDDMSEEPPLKKIKENEIISNEDNKTEQTVEEWINIYSCVKGSLLQPNLKLLTEPQLLLRKVRYTFFLN